MKTILIVDDEEVIRFLLQNELEEKGHRVLTADNGQGALELLLKEADLQLVITDLKHPKTGWPGTSPVDQKGMTEVAGDH